MLPRTALYGLYMLHTGGSFFWQMLSGEDFLLARRVRCLHARIYYCGVSPAAAPP